MLFDWTISEDERALVNQIVDRCYSVMQHFGDVDRLELEMDIIACHKYGARLDLEKLLGFDDFNFAHDIVGIREHLNRETGELERHFLPRATAQEASHAEE